MKRRFACHHRFAGPKQVGRRRRELLERPRPVVAQGTTLDDKEWKAHTRPRDCTRPDVANPWTTLASWSHFCLFIRRRATWSFPVRSNWGTGRSGITTSEVPIHRWPSHHQRPSSEKPLTASGIMRERNLIAAVPLVSAA